MTSAATINSILNNFSPILRENIKSILTDVDFGISHQRLKINTGLKYIPEYTEKYIDSFILEIPVAGKYLEWEIVFQEEDYSYAPDFDFVNDLFLFNPDVDVIQDRIPSLAQWDVSDSKCLCRVIHEFFKLYQEYQVMKLHTQNSYSRLLSEYEEFMSKSDVCKENVELYIDNPGAVHLLMGITVDCSVIPPYVQKPNDSGIVLNPHTDMAKLKVSFVKPDCSKVQSNLQLTPRLEQTIGSASNLRIPVYKRETTLLSYVTEITKLLKDRVAVVANHYRMKHEFVTSLAAECGSSMVEYDGLLFSKATLLIKSMETYAVVIISLGEKFPQEKPKVTLNSVYHLKNDKPFSQHLDYPYSPRWKCDEMIKRLLTHITDKIPEFNSVAQQHLSI